MSPGLEKESSLYKYLFKMNFQSVEIIQNNRKGLHIIELTVIILISFFYTNFEIQSTFLISATLLTTAYALYFGIKDAKLRKIAWGVVIGVSILSLMYLFLTDTQSVGDVSNRELKRFFSKYGQYMFMFFPVLMFYRTILFATKRQIMIILLVILTNSLIVANVAIQAASINAEILHTFDQAAMEDVGLSFAGYYFVYAFTFLVLTGFIGYKYGSDKKIKYVSLALALFSFYFLIKAQFALSVVTTVASLVYFYNVTARDKSKGVLVIFFTIVFLLLLPLIIKFVVSISSSRILNDRLMEVYDGLTGENTTNGSDGQGRLELYWMTIQAFLSSPIVGNRTLPADGHATFLTLPADIGIFGAFFLYKLIKNLSSLIMDMMGDKSIFFKPLLFQIILMGFTNPIHTSPSIYIYLFYFCPIVIILYVKNKIIPNHL